MMAPRRAPAALVVEPDPATARLCRATLEQAGFAVRCAETGVGALVLAREMVPGIILLATQLRDVPGRSVMDWLKAEPPLNGCPLIVLGTGGELAPPTGTFLRKPFSTVALRRAVEEACSVRPDENE